MRIGELSRATGASPRALRYYEEHGLLRSQREDNGYRAYDASAVEAVATVRSLLDLGFSSELIRRILPCTGDDGPVAGDCDALVRRMSEVRDDMDEKVRRLTQTRDALTEFLQRAVREAASA